MTRVAIHFLVFLLFAVNTDLFAMERNADLSPQEKSLQSQVAAQEHTISTLQQELREVKQITAPLAEQIIKEECHESAFALAQGKKYYFADDRPRDYARALDYFKEAAAQDVCKISQAWGHAWLAKMYCQSYCGCYSKALADKHAQVATSQSACPDAQAWGWTVLAALCYCCGNEEGALGCLQNAKKSEDPFVRAQVAISLAHIALDHCRKQADAGKGQYAKEFRDRVVRFVEPITKAWPANSEPCSSAYYLMGIIAKMDALCDWSELQMICGKSGPLYEEVQFDQLNNALAFFNKAYTQDSNPKAKSDAAGEIFEIKARLVLKKCVIM